MKLLCGLRMTLIDLAHHPVVPPVHVDPNLDQPSSFVYPIKFSVHVVECRVLAAHSTTHDHLQRSSLASANAFDPGFQIAGRKEVDYAIGPNLSQAGGREAEGHEDKLPWVMRIGS